MHADTLVGNPLTGNSYLTDKRANAYILAGSDASEYLVSTEIVTKQVSMRLFYLAPSDKVNATTRNFSNQLLLLSVVMIALFALILAIAFIFFYKNRKKQFDKQLVTREIMFSKLIENGGVNPFSTSREHRRFSRIRILPVTAKSHH